MKFRKLMAVALVAAMAATMAVGCGGSSSDKSAEGSTDNSSADSGSDFDTSNDITIVSREDGSGTRGAFIELFMYQVIFSIADLGEKVKETDFIL